MCNVNGPQSDWFSIYVQFNLLCMFNVNGYQSDWFSIYLQFNVLCMDSVCAVRQSTLNKSNEIFENSSCLCLRYIAVYI